MLPIMEKNLDREHNLTAARATWDAGLHTVYQIVLGMPGPTSGIRDYRSLRQIMRENAPAPVTEGERNMIPLRLGR